MCFNGGVDMLRRQFFTRTIGALVGAVCAPFAGKAAEPILIGSDVVPFTGPPLCVFYKDGVYVTYDRGKTFRKLAHFLEFTPSEALRPPSPAMNLHKMDELVNNILRKQSEQARLAADPGAT
jgi:hypothetical protein